MKRLYNLAAAIGIGPYIIACSTQPVTHPDLDLYDAQNWEDSLHNFSIQRPLPESTEAAPDQCSAEITVLSYNVRAIPGFEGRNTEAFDRIGEILEQRRRDGTQPDIVLLQEAFKSEHIDAIRARAKYPYELQGPHKNSRLLLDNGSGLEIWSDLKILDSIAFAYTDSDPFESLARKSAILTKVHPFQVPVPIIIGTTHLNAGSELKLFDRIRVSQATEFKDVHASFNPEGLPSILAADFNFKPKHGSYYHFLDMFSDHHDVGAYCLLEDDCEVIIEDPEEPYLTPIWKTTNDRHFFSDSADQKVTVRPQKVIRNFAEKIDGEELSDHHGYEVTYDISWNCSSFQP